MATSPEQWRAEFVEEIKSWKLDGKGSDTALIDESLQRALLEGYDDLMAYAHRIGRALRKAGGRNDSAQNNYDVFWGANASFRSQIMQGLAVMPMLNDILKTEQVNGDYGTAMRLAGSVIQQAAMHAYMLEWMPDKLLVNEVALGGVRLEDVRSFSLEERRKMREVK